MSKSKSKQIVWLGKHLLIQFITFWFVLSMVVGIKSATLFAGLNTAIHGLIDWNIWRIYVRSVAWRRTSENSLKLIEGEYPYWKDDVFIATFGLDQLLHFLTITILWMYL